jgi:hypothetical protein
LIEIVRIGYDMIRTLNPEKEEKKEEGDDEGRNYCHKAGRCVGETRCDGRFLG